MKRKLTVEVLIIPIIVAALLLLPLLGAAVIGEHRYEMAHPAYLQHFWLRLLGEESDVLPDDAAPDGDVPVFSFLSFEETAEHEEQENKLNILVLGKDQWAGLTDVMMIASLDRTDHSLRLLQLPRDTYAAYTDRPYRKLNGAYSRLGGQGLVTFLRENMGIPIDYFVCVDLSVVGEVVDTIGGVRLTVPADMDYDDETQNLHIHLKAGEQVLDGDMAQMFVRFRSGYATADIGRMDAQKIFLSAFARQAKESLTLPQTVALACQCFGKVKTDMGILDCISCVKELRRVDLSQMHMMTLPGASARTQGNRGAWYFILNRDATAAALSDVFGEAVGSAFDPSGVFNNAGKASFDQIYHGAAGKYKTHDYTADDALGGNVKIKRIA